MKTTSIVLALAWFGAIALGAQIVQSKTGPAGATDAALPYEEVDRDAHTRVWARVSFDTNVLGEVTTRTNTFVELQTGLHYREGDHWLASEAKIEILPNNVGAAATKGQHKVIFPLEIKSGIIELQTPDNQWLRSRVVGLAYFDGATGESVLLAVVKASEGQLVGENTVLYPDAFTDGCLADIKYHYSLAGLEQDVVIRSQIPDPEKFGLSRKSTRLQVISEFVSAPVPTLESRQAGALADQSLGFGQMSIGSGKAFSVDVAGDTTGDIAVAKEWAPLEGRDFLIEEVPYEAVADQLQKLPAPAEHRGASLQRRGKGQNVIAGLKSSLPPRYAQGAPQPSPKRMARITPKAAPAFVMDYVLLTSQTNFTFAGNTNYYVSGLVNLSGSTAVEGGVIIKYTNHPSAKISMSGSLVCKTDPYRPAIFTSKDDNTVGETIPGSTGNPTNYNGGTYLFGASGNVTYKYLRLSYAGTAIDGGLGSSTTGGIWHCQFFRCGTCLHVDDDDGYLYDVLFTQCNTVLGLGADNVKGAHITADQIGTFYASFHSATLTNSILTAVTNLGYGVTLYNSATNASGSGIYQTVGASSYYLAASSTNRNVGSTNLNAALLADLKSRTTYPPIEITTNFTASTTLSPQAQRDTDSPDLGFHYTPLDFVVSGRTLTNATLTLTNGVALGTYGPSTSYGLYVRKNGVLLSEGWPTNLNHIGRYNAVQEQSTTNWSAASVAGCVQLSADTAAAPQGRFRFTEWSLPGGKGYYYYSSYNATPASFSDCQMGPGSFYTLGATVLTNCLWERAAVNLDVDTPAVDYHVYNNLFQAGSLVVHQEGNKVCVLRDNLFDRVTLSQIGTITHDHNAYLSGGQRLTPTNASDKVLTNAPVYQAGALGKYYYPTNDGMLSLLSNAGSRPADDAGFYHYTMHTNQVKETNSFLDIGFHYMALNTNGIPTDANGDGVFDYLDSNSTPRTDIVWSNSIWCWKADSLAWNCWTNTLVCTNGAQGNFPNMLTQFSPTDERNTNFWLRRFKGWPAYAVWNNGDTNVWPTNTIHTSGSGVTYVTYQGAGVMVSSEHVLTAGHMRFATNTWLAFMDMSNNVVFRQVKDYFYKSVYGGETTNNLSTNMPSATFGDYYIGLLDAPVPASIGYVKIIPTNWWAWFDAPFYNNATNNTYHVPLYLQNCQHRTPVMKDLVSLTCYSEHRYESFDLLTLTNWNHDTAVGGDSGSPWFITLDGELCLAKILSSSLNFGVEYEFNAAAYVQASVNAAMRELSLRNGHTNIYSLTVKDLSKYPNYGQSYNCSP